VNAIGGGLDTRETEREREIERKREENIWGRVRYDYYFE